ncbi:hypothetical protein ABIC24_003181 [Methylobacterium radiotolerans]
MTDRPALDVVIVNWNGGSLLRACLASLAAARDAAAVQVTVVDNASTDGSAETLPALPRPLRLIQNAANLGFGRACDQGAAAGDAPAILFLNPDTQVAPDALGVALAALTADRRTGIVGARLVDPDGRTARSCARAPSALGLVGRALALDRLGLVRPHFLREWDHAEDRAVDQVMGAFLMIRRDLFRALGGFDPRFFVYWEDADLCARAPGGGLRGAARGRGGRPPCRPGHDPAGAGAAAVLLPAQPDPLCRQAPRRRDGPRPGGGELRRAGAPAARPGPRPSLPPGGRGGPAGGGPPGRGVAGARAGPPARRARAARGLSGMAMPRALGAEAGRPVDPAGAAAAPGMRP